MSNSIYCENCRILLGRNQNLSKDEVKEVRSCNCLSKYAERGEEERLSYKLNRRKKKW